MTVDGEGGAEKKCSDTILQSCRARPGHSRTGLTFLFRLPEKKIKGGSRGGGGGGKVGFQDLFVSFFLFIRMGWERYPGIPLDVSSRLTLCLR